MLEIMESDEEPPSLPWRANPAAGMVIGMTVLFLFLVGPIALVIPLIAWIVYKQRSEARRRTGTGSDPD